MISKEIKGALALVLNRKLVLAIGPVFLIGFLKRIVVRAHLVSWSDFKRSEAEAIHYVQVPCLLL
ncbi:hypothetical protein BCY86_07565 [Pajaroellobacter abortibovis]|uniref:Uncharacterized protein n=1 Tax=Pajaroellobacter abortibovis TaxID=1882918 RepID=A0A1L6MYK6_9BACT|nr:hypothetical protein BCY86_07565 [Pajaroellobacter abortibovis]